jgi:DNA-directed RNA polymerase specialized sigma24 family protein
VVHGDSEDGFRVFVTRVEPRLRRALTAAYGYERGREATAEALAYAWEHWDRVAGLSNPAGYLYRVGQSRTRNRKLPAVYEVRTFDDPVVEPELASGVAGLSERQRVCVFLVFGFGWTRAEVAQLLGIGEGTVQRHLDRGLDRLRKVIVKEQRRNA